MYLADIKRDDRFEGYLIVRSAEQRASANGKNYLDMTLADKSGSINAKMWDGTVQPPLAGSIVKVRATGNEFNGRMQLRVEKIRAAESRDAERGTRAALSVLVFIRFAVCFNHSDIFRKIENGGFDQFIQAVGIKGKALFL